MTDLQARLIDTLWDKIVKCYREACLLRHKGLIDESMGVLTTLLPQAIAEWSQVNPEEADTKRSKLTRMFEDEDERIENALVITQVMSSNLQDMIIPQLCMQVAKELTENVSIHEQVTVSRTTPAQFVDRRIPIDDVAGMIDNLLDCEHRKKAKKAAVA